MARKGTGIFKRGEIYHVDKVVRWGRIRGTTGTTDRAEAELWLAQRLQELRDTHVNGVRQRHTFKEAAAQLLKRNADKKSVMNDLYHLDMLMPYIGGLDIRAVHDGTLEPFVADRLKAGRKHKTVNLSLEVARKVLNLCARALRDTEGRPWLDTAPMVTMLDVTDAAQPYPLDWDEQERLLKELPGHLERMALYALHTGCREQEICGLKWAWENRVEGGSVFVLPGARMKNGEPGVVVLNSVAQSIVDGQRGQHPEYVFGFEGQAIAKMHTAAWRKAWRRAGLPESGEYLKGVHNLRHTFARRLRAAGVAHETVRVLMRHKTKDMTAHYSVAEVGELREALEKLVMARPVGRTILRVVA